VISTSSLSGWTKAARGKRAGGAGGIT